MYEHYTYRLSWSPDDAEYVGTCTEFPSLSHLAGDPVEALQGIRDLVKDVVADMKANHEPIPAPFAETEFSGKFMVRVPPELHRRLAIEAAEAHVSLNRIASLRLASSDVFVTAPSEEPEAPRRARRKQRQAA